MSSTTCSYMLRNEVPRRTRDGAAAPRCPAGEDVAGRERLGVVDVEAGPGDRPVPQRVDQRRSSTIGPRLVLISTAVRRICDSSPAPNRPRVRSDRTRWIESTSERASSSSLRRASSADLGGALGGQVLAPGDHLHPERPRRADHRRAEMAEPGEPERRAAEVGRQVGLPAARPDRAILDRDSLEHRQDQRPGHLGRARDATAGRRRHAAGAGDDDAATARWSTSRDALRIPVVIDHCSAAAGSAPPRRTGCARASVPAPRSRPAARRGARAGSAVDEVDRRPRRRASPSRRSPAARRW